MSWFVAVVNRFSIFEATSKYRKQSENKYSSWWRPVSASSNCILCSDMYDYAPSLYTHKTKKKKQMSKKSIEIVKKYIDKNPIHYEKQMNRENISRVHKTKKHFTKTILCGLQAVVITCLGHATGRL